MTDPVEAAIEARCKNCMFFLPKGKCRRFPPTQYYDIKEVKSVTAYPAVAVEMWCGEYRARIDAEMGKAGEK